MEHLKYLKRKRTKCILICQKCGAKAIDDGGYCPNGHGIVLMATVIDKNRKEK